MINVTCAVIRNEDNEVLVVQRGEATDHPYKWEFPGGKLLPGESGEEGIIREVKEELSMEIVIIGKLPEVEHDYGHKQIRLMPFICDTLDEFPFLSEHQDFKWLPSSGLLSPDFTEADVFVAKDYLERIKDDLNPGSQTDNIEDETFPDNHELQSMINRMISMKEVDWIATSAIDNPAIFNKLLEFSFSDDKKLAFHASWTLTKVCDKYPEIIYPFLPGIIEKLARLENESAQRSFLRIISLSNINRIGTRHHGILAEHCFTALRSGFSAIAIKAYSMEVLYKIALIYPELVNELSASVNMLQGDGSAGVVARGKMIMKKLAELPKKSGSGK
jgi:8-oxo-dGTP diphosphatase